MTEEKITKSKNFDSLISDKSPDDWRLVYLPEYEIEKAAGICDVMQDRWFMVHPERGLLFFQSTKSRIGQITGSSPQCHRSKEMAEHLRRRLWPWAELRFYERVILPINMSDYT